MIRIVDPVGEPHSQPGRLAPRVGSFDGLVVGILVNEKGDATATDFEQDSGLLEARLRETFAVRDVVRVIKSSAFKPADEATIAALAASADVVINGLAK